jgi:putative ubiquitin-RnfH superfamily antitoxin RatB of RatAB toxin-antitoxin module
MLLQSKLAVVVVANRPLLLTPRPIQAQQEAQACLQVFLALQSFTEAAVAAAVLRLEEQAVQMQAAAEVVTVAQAHLRRQIEEGAAVERLDNPLPRPMAAMVAPAS